MTARSGYARLGRLLCAIAAVSPLTWNQTGLFQTRSQKPKAKSTDSTSPLLTSFRRRFDPPPVHPTQSSTSIIARQRLRQENAVSPSSLLATASFWAQLRPLRCMVVRRLVSALVPKAARNSAVSHTHSYSHRHRHTPLLPGGSTRDLTMSCAPTTISPWRTCRFFRHG